MDGVAEEIGAQGVVVSAEGGGEKMGIVDAPPKEDFSRPTSNPPPASVEEEEEAVSDDDRALSSFSHSTSRVPSKSPPRTAVVVEENALEEEEEDDRPLMSFMKPGRKVLSRTTSLVLGDRRRTASLAVEQETTRAASLPADLVAKKVEQQLAPSLKLSTQVGEGSRHSTAPALPLTVVEAPSPSPAITAPSSIVASASPPPQQSPSIPTTTDSTEAPTPPTTHVVDAPNDMEFDAPVSSPRSDSEPPIAISSSRQSSLSAFSSFSRPTASLDPPTPRVEEEDAFRSNLLRARAGAGSPSQTTNATSSSQSVPRPQPQPQPASAPPPPTPHAASVSLSLKSYRSPPAQAQVEPAPQDETDMKMDVDAPSPPQPLLPPPQPTPVVTAPAPTPLNQSTTFQIKSTFTSSLPSPAPTSPRFLLLPVLPPTRLRASTCRRSSVGFQRGSDLLWMSSRRGRGRGGGRRRGVTS